MNKETFYFMNLTPMHVATGETSPLDDSIKGAIQRHPITNVPIIPGSSFKGSLRSNFLINMGNDDAALKLTYDYFGEASSENGGKIGAFNFSDLHIIAQPINILEQYGKTYNYKTVYLMSKKHLTLNINKEQNKKYCIYDTTIDGILVSIEDVTNDLLKKRLMENPYAISNIFYVDDTVFNILTEQAIWVRTRTALYSSSQGDEYEQRLKKQVANGSLWKDEFIVEGAVWELNIIKRSQISINDIFECIKKNNYISLYVGGLETIGCGLMEVLL